MYYQQQLQQLSDRWDVLDFTPVDERKPFVDEYQAMHRNTAILNRQITRYNQLDQQLRYDYLLNGLKAARSQVEDGAFARAFEQYIRAEGARVQAEILAFGSVCGQLSTAVRQLPAT